MKGKRNVKIVYGFGANVAFIVALLFATMWAAYKTQAVVKVQNYLPKSTPSISHPAPAASPMRPSNTTLKIAAGVNKQMVG